MAARSLTYRAGEVEAGRAEASQAGRDRPRGEDKALSCNRAMFSKRLLSPCILPLALSNLLSFQTKIDNFQHGSFQKTLENLAFTGWKVVKL